jgi:photosystem II stability/assembly factor-like uncharacterized protein
MRVAALLLALAATAPLTLQAQWTIQTPTTADLRGIDNVGNGIAWASGTNGTVLRTEDAGYLWQRCTIPPNAEHLDFRGIQAFDANTAIVMSSGPGDQSRLYKTTDGCQTWTLLFTNPDKAGFWDFLNVTRQNGTIMVIGDPVGGHFAGFSDFKNFGEDKDPIKFRSTSDEFPEAAGHESIFAASNTSFAVNIDRLTGVLGTGGSSETRVFVDRRKWTPHVIEGFAHGESGGIFSVGNNETNWIAVGGDYKQPNLPAGTAAYSSDDGATWQLATTPPHGYRSAVAYDAPTKTWITVGPNGTDISTDDGRNWRPLHPTNNDALDADQHWNALSLPYAVGPHGRIGILNPSALKPISTKP